LLVRRVIVRLNEMRNPGGVKKERAGERGRSVNFSAYARSKRPSLRREGGRRVDADADALRAEAILRMERLARRMREGGGRGYARGSSRRVSRFHFVNVLSSII